MEINAQEKLLDFFANKGNHEVIVIPRYAISRVRELFKKTNRELYAINQLKLKHQRMVRAGEYNLNELSDFIFDKYKTVVLFINDFVLSDMEVIKEFEEDHKHFQVIIVDSPLLETIAPASWIFAIKTVDSLVWEAWLGHGIL